MREGVVMVRFRSTRRSSESGATPFVFPRGPSLGRFSTAYEMIPTYV